MCVFFGESGGYKGQFTHYWHLFTRYGHPRAPGLRKIDANSVLGANITHPRDLASRDPNFSQPTMFEFWGKRRVFETGGLTKGVSINKSDPEI